MKPDPRPAYDKHGPERAGRSLRRARIDAGLSQHDLAYLSGVSDRQIRNIESGRCRPTRRTLISLLVGMGRGDFPGKSTMDAKAAKGRNLAKAGDGYGDPDPYHDGAAAGFASSARILRESTAIGGEVPRGR